MPWRVEREVKPDGTIVCRAVYESEQTGPYRTYHITYITCPICGERGELLAIYHRSNGKWCGPYFQVKHLLAYYDRKEYRQLREQGMSSYLAGEKAIHQLHLYVCYIGKRFPGVIKKPIPTPDGSTILMEELK